MLRTGKSSSRNGNVLSRFDSDAIINLDCFGKIERNQFRVGVHCGFEFFERRNRCNTAGSSKTHDSVDFADFLLYEIGLTGTTRLFFIGLPLTT